MHLLRVELICESLDVRVAEEESTTFYREDQLSRMQAGNLDKVERLSAPASVAAEDSQIPTTSVPLNSDSAEAAVHDEDESDAGRRRYYPLKSRGASTRGAWGGIR